MIDTSVLDRIVNSVDIVSLASSSANLKKSGSRYSCRCPFHADNDASLVIYPATNTWHCFGCGKGSSIFDWIMERDSVSFYEAATTLGKQVGIDVSPSEPPTPQEINFARKKEKALSTLQIVNSFFVSSLKRSQKAIDYVNKRWDTKISDTLELGYAPSSWDSLIQFSEEKDLDIDLLVELGLVRVNEQKQKAYDFFRDRITIPVRDLYGNIVGWSCRYIGDDVSVPKYMNSADSFLFTKSDLLYNAYSAKRQAIKEKRIYVVEGCPDAIKLQHVGIHNVVAPMGTSLSDKQLKILRRFAEEIVFVPDIDINNAGIKAVLKNGQSALASGFITTIKLLPSSDAGEKVDVDNCVVNKVQFNSFHEEDFILFLADNLFASAKTLPRKLEARKEIASILKRITDDSLRKDYISRLSELGYGDKLQWKLALETKKNIHTDNGAIDTASYERYGFLQEGNCYYSHNKEGERVAWSNFVMRPLFHIVDTINPKRLYEVTNVFGLSILLEMKQEELTSIAKFKTKVEGAGNFIWMVGERELTKLKCYLYDETESAHEIKQLGWQKNGGFWAWGNGGVENGFFSPANDYGIIKTDAGNFYLPATSKIFALEQELFQFERKFVHRSDAKCDFVEYSQRMKQVYGSNGSVGVLFALCTLFKDIVIRSTNTFPILNVFGPKGTGKSALGVSLMSLFIPKNKPINITNSTLPAMSDSVAQCSNALVHLDEYRNDIDVDKREFLKGLWDNVGRSRMNMDRDKKREITSVDSGIIISGQHMATADIALFSRFIFISFNQTSFSNEERKNWSELNHICEHGLSAIVNNLLRHRPLVEISFHRHFDDSLQLLSSQLETEKVEDRILRNWVILLAIYRCLKKDIHFPFSEEELIQIIVQGIKTQSSECSTNNEISNFWDFLPILLQMGVIFEGSDYRIDTVLDLRTDKSSFIFKNEKKVLYLRYQKVFNDYQVESKRSGQEVLPTSSLRYYLEKSPLFLGYKNSVRFKHVVKGMPQMAEKSGSLAAKDTVSRCMVFDYDQLQKEFNITLETII